MISRFIKYGGLSGKVRAMYANRLTSEDFKKLAAIGTVPEIAMFLKTHPGWSGALDELSIAEIHRGSLEARLRNHLLDEYQRIFKFMARDDRPIMTYPISRAEIDQIMLFLRFLKAGRPQDYVFSAPVFYKDHSRIDFDALRECTSYSGFLDIMRGSPYFASLVALTPPGGETPEYPVIETVLRVQYYHNFLSSVDKHYHGEIQSILRSSIGMQVDVLNLTRVVRLRRYFQVSGKDVWNYLIPVHFKLKPAYIEALFAAQDEQSAQSLLLSGPYGKLFSAHSFNYIEEYYYQQLYDFNHAYIHSGVPSVYTAIAYLTLRDIELKDLINVIELVRYGTPVDRAPTMIVSM